MSTTEVRPLRRMRAITTAVMVATVVAVGAVPLVVSTPPIWEILAVTPSLIAAAGISSQWHAPPRRAYLMGALAIGEATWIVAVLVGMDPATVIGVAVAGGIAVATRRDSRYATAFTVLLVVEATALLSLITQPDATGSYLIVGLWYTVIFAAVFWLNDITWRLFTDLDSMRHTEAELAVMKERVRFAADLHDIQGHTLHVIKLKAAVAAKLQHTDPERVAMELADIERLTGETIEQAQLLVNSTRQLSFSAELANASALISATGIEVDVDGADSSPVNDEVFALVLREGTTNILRHPSPTAVHIEVTADAMAITNDGADSETRPLRGLAALRERVAAAGGSLTVAQREDEFTLSLAFADGPR
ncbi:sensor histidine kinase [Demequina sp. NBRC 110055]|uniref:sensor histidine kinase n=1 Tax=Demequina sp. NBRC 110055 TaxID=1570344 RepID=UPI0009FD3572|nr:histidine kinase [Demequina sp. NBRC 110055]